MKKIFFVAAAMALLAAGCNSASAPSQQQPTEQQSDQPSAQAPSQQPTAAQQVAAQTTVNTQVNSVDSAVNLIEKDSSNQQAVAAAGDDSDLTTNDSADLAGMTEVPNAQ